MKDFSLGVLTIIALAFMFDDESKDESVASNKGREYFCYMVKEHILNQDKNPYSNKYDELPIIVEEEHSYSDEDFILREVCEIKTNNNGRKI